MDEGAARTSGPLVNGRTDYAGLTQYFAYSPLQTLLFFR